MPLTHQLLHYYYYFLQGYKGITTFIVPKETEGLSLGKKEDKVCFAFCLVTIQRFGVKAKNPAMIFVPVTSV